MKNQISERTIFKAERRAKAIDLLGGKCVRCDSIERLEFDHIENDRINTSHCLSLMWQSTWEKILIELKKCQLLCRSCHAKKSMKDRGFKSGVLHGRSLYVVAKCRCDICKEDRKIAQRAYRKRLAMA